MPGLPRQNLFLPVGGLQSDIDDKVLPLGRMLDLENCYVQRKGQQDGTCEAIKRYGFTALATPAGIAGQLGTHQGALIESGFPLKTLATPTSAAWTSASGDFRPGITASLLKVFGDAVVPDLAVGGGYYWAAAQDVTVNASGHVNNATTIKYVALDVVTGHVAFSGSIPVTGGGATLFNFWGIVYCAGKAVLVTGNDGGYIRSVTIDPATFATSTTSTAAATAVQAFDVIVTGAVVQIVFNNATPVARCLDFDPIGLAYTAWSPKDAAAADIPLDSGAAFVQDFGGAGKIAIATVSGAQGLRMQWDVPATGATRQAASTYNLDAAVTIIDSRAIAAHTTLPSSSGEFVVIWTDASTPMKVQTATRIGGSLTGATTIARGCRLQSRTWMYGSDSFVIVNHVSPTNGTDFVIRVPTAAVTTATPLCKIGVRNVTTSFYGLSRVVTTGTGQFAAALFYVPRFDSGPNPDAYGVEIAQLSHPIAGVPSALGVSREAIGSTFVPGGSVGQFDGAYFLDAGFAYAPEPAQPQAATVGGGLTPSSTYYYQILYSYMDAQGRVWRSGTSVPATGTTTGVNFTIPVKCPTLRLSGRPNLKIEIYRGAAGDAVLFQKVAVIQNVITADTVTYTDSTTDLALASGEFCYTNGGILNNDTPPGFVSTVEAGGRTWGISTDDSQLLWDSKTHALQSGLEFSGDFTTAVRDQHGPMRALAQVDGRPIVFKDDALYGVGGQGPDNRGQGGSYAAAIIGSGIGCNNPQAICETRDGVIFRSTSTRAGFWQLDRGLSLTYIGAPVQRYNGETITASAFLPLSLQARFYTASGRTLVFDLVTGIWTTFTGQPCVTATSWNGTAVYTSSASANVLREDTTGATLTDDGLPTTMLVGWPWLQANQIRGYQRFYKQQLTGEVAQGSVTINMRLYRDLSAFAIASALLPTPVGVIDRELKYSAKVGALKCAVTDLGSTTGILKVSGITLMLGLKRGMRPTANENRLT